MGTDIHVYMQHRTNNEWHTNPDVGDVDELLDPFYDRNYNLFACIADIRNYYDIPHMDTYKPIPQDLNDDTLREEMYEWGCVSDCYVATLKEFHDFYKQQPRTFTKHGVLFGQQLDEFEKNGTPPNCWCAAYYGNERSKLCSWEVDEHPMDDFMTTLLTLSHMYCGKVLPVEDLRDGKSINEFVAQNGNDIRAIFWFDS